MILMAPMFLLICVFTGFAVAAAYMLWQSRRRTQDAFLAFLAVSIERGVPLAPAIEAFARDQGGSMGRRARQAADLLRAGWSLPDVLQHVGGLVPQKSLVLINVGQQTGSLAPAIRCAAGSREPYLLIWVQLTGRLLYLGALVVFAGLIATFMLLKIALAFRKIFEDFGMELPPLTRLVVDASRWANHWLVFLFGFLILVLVPLVLLWAFDRLPVALPVVGRLARRLHTAVILESLSLAVSQQRPIAETIGSLARWYPRWPIRRRLTKVAADVQRGQDWDESLAAHGFLGKTDLVVLKTAERVGNLDWALREMADSSRRRLAYRLTMLVQLMYPVVIVSFGILVMAYVVGFFMPLIALIQNLT